MSKLINKSEPNILWTDDPEEILKQKNKKKYEDDEFNPSEFTLSIRLEKKGRGGKVVSVIYDFPKNSLNYFKKLTKKLKRVCGSGGTYKVDSIEVQGDHREAIKGFLLKEGFKVKFTGG